MENIHPWFVSERLCPIFQVSNVSGENLDLLKMFLNLLSSRQPNTDDEPSEFQIDDTYLVPGVGKSWGLLNDKACLLGMQQTSFFTSLYELNKHIWALQYVLQFS